MAAARVLLQFERPDDDPPRPPRQIDWAKLNPEQREQVRAALTLLAQVSGAAQSTTVAGRLIEASEANATQPARAVHKRIAASSNPSHATNAESTDDCGGALDRTVAAPNKVPVDTLAARSEGS